MMCIFVISLKTISKNNITGILQVYANEMYCKMVCLMTFCQTLTNT